MSAPLELKTKMLITKIRGWVADRLGLKSAEARSGSWWEVDFIIVLLLGSGLAAVLAWGSA